MSKLARLLTVVLLAAFAAATLAPAADATAMTLKMSLMPMDAGADCEGCSGDQDKAPPCDQACMTSLPALPAGMALESPAAAAGVEAAPGGFLASWSGPPDPFPPRASLLS